MKTEFSDDEIRAAIGKKILSSPNRIIISAGMAGEPGTWASATGAHGYWYVDGPEVSVLVADTDT